MSKTRTHHTLIGDDGELTTPIVEQTGEESVYAALPELFLLDPAHAAYIAEKKLKPAEQKRRRLLPGKGVIAWASGLGLALALLFTQPYLVNIFGIVVVSLIAYGYIWGFVWLLDLLLARQDKRDKRYMFSQGMLLKGEITYHQRGISGFDIVGRETINLNDEIGYRFFTPKGHKIDARQLIPHRVMPDDEKRSVRVEVGTPVAVLYVDDHRYMLL